MFERYMEKKALIENITAIAELAKNYLIMATNMHKSMSNVDFRAEMEFRLLNELVEKAVAVDEELIYIAREYQFNEGISPDVQELMQNIVEEDKDTRKGSRPVANDIEKLNKIFPPKEKEEAK